MKRSEALKALSHQHHQGLYAALKLKRADSDTAAEARRIFLDFYEREGARHFRAEEELLLPAYARHTDFDRVEIVRVLTEHVDLRRRGQDLETDAGADRRRCASSASGSSATSASRSASSSR